MIAVPTQWSAPMLWFYRRDEELITVETRFDDATRE
jgi:hypothetical protein